MADDPCWLKTGSGWEKTSLQNEKVQSENIVRAVLNKSETRPTSTQNCIVTKYVSG
jgi:hypothetical protein